MSPSSGNTSLKASLRAANVAEVDVEDLLALAEPADHVGDLVGRIVEHLADRSLAEVQPVIGALAHRHEFLQPLHRAEHAGDAAIAGRRVGVVRVTGEPDAVRLGDRNHPFQEIVDPLPVLVFRRGRRRCSGGAFWSAFSQRKDAFRDPPRPASGSVRGMPMMLRLYFAAGMPTSASRSIRRADGIDLAVAVRPGGQDVGAVLFLDRPRTQRQLHHVEHEPEATRRGRDGASGRRATNRADCPADRDRRAGSRAARAGGIRRRRAADSASRDTLVAPSPKNLAPCRGCWASHRRPG